MVEKKEELINLDNEKKKLEQKITELSDYLTQPGFPGIDGSLIDKDGFPKAGIDLVAIRAARHELVCAQNDYKNLMEIIEKKMMCYFDELNKNKQKIIEEDKNDRKIYTKEETEVDACKEEPNNKNIKNERVGQGIQEPFAKIISVFPGSPAEEAGLKSEDLIIKFNNILYKGVSHNPLLIVSEIVKNKVGQKIPICLVRKNDKNILEVLNLFIVPHSWEGKGFLGCKLNII